MVTASRSLRLDRLRSLVCGFGALLDQVPAEQQILAEGSTLLANLVRHDDWLPPAFAAPDPGRYQQYLLHCDSRARFSVVSFVWGPSQATPIHDHTVWGLIGILRGSEIAQSYVRPNGLPIANGPPRKFLPGDVDMLSPVVGDIHKVSNALPDRCSISIHVYGADIGAVHRSVFTVDGVERQFVSGYANDVLPNIWGTDYE
jgi:predicted metal-dependent enzyme (double-stranded beta helix superfamily)